MDNNKIEMYMISNSKYFNAADVYAIKQKLESLPPEDDYKLNAILTTPLMDPVMMLVISLFGGSLGIDRFFLRQVGTGIAKLLTFGGCGIWTIVDWFLIMGTTKDQNFQKIMSMT